MQLVDHLPLANILGEGIIWDFETQSAWWTDIMGEVLFKYDPVTKIVDKWSLPERLACFALVEDADYLVCGFASGFAFYQPQTGVIEWLHKIEPSFENTRLNDGRADRQGRFWAGSMREYDLNGQLGALYCLDQDLVLSAHLDQLAISNGLCFSPDLTTLYHTDTPSQKIYAYPFSETGILGAPSLLVETESGASPDGSTIDAQGYIWNAQWGASQVVRYTPAGEVDRILKLPASQVTCVAFGGPDMNLLFVTSAKQGLSEAALAAEPAAGDVFVFETDVTGLPDPRFKGAWSQ